MLPLALLFTGLVVVGALSPILTFAALFQQKEWRLDRLREHLRRDGWMGQLIGKIRGHAFVIYITLQALFLLSLPFTPDHEILLSVLAGMVFVSLLFLLFLTALSCIQIITHRQRMPVWTTKAKLITATALFLTLLMALPMIYAGGLTQSFEARLIILTSIIILPAAAVLQFAVVMCSWALWLPVDAVLKKRIMDKAAAYRSILKNATVIGIAGSVGKTTTKELIAHVLQDLKPLTTPVHVNTEMGVAQWLTGKKADVFIIEMGAYRRGEIALLCNIAQPTLGVMTALGSDHLALFGSEEAIVQANGELIEALPPGSHAFLYGENDGCKKLAATADKTTHLTGSNNLQPTDILENDQGISFKAGGSTFHLPLHGRHNVHNALLAIGIARQLGIRDERIKELLKTFRPPAHTFNVRTEQGVLLLDDTYNISPLSMGAALDWATHQEERPRILLTSGLQETGAEENRFLRELGGKAKGSIERVIFTQPHGASIFAEGYGSGVEILNAQTARIVEGSVLLAVGRMPLSTVQRLLPSS